MEAVFQEKSVKGEVVMVKTKTKESDLDSMLGNRYQWESMQRLTVEALERRLAQPEYKVRGYWDKSQLSETEQKQVKAFESIHSFGADVANLFEILIERHGYVPSQEEFIKEGVSLTKEWFCDNAFKNPKLKGLPFNSVVQRAAEERLARTWISVVVELHTKLLIQETLPHLKVIQHDLLDLVMGVDLIVEDDKKRYFIHIFKNTSWGMKAFKMKEKRGGLMKGKRFIKYKRDFTGDSILAYEWDSRTDHTSTKFINGIPLFKAEFIEWKFRMMKRTPSIGEDVNTKHGKMDQLNDWIYKYFGQKAKFE